jgi:hypothetical protein
LYPTVEALGAATDVWKKLSVVDLLMGLSAFAISKVELSLGAAFVRGLIPLFSLVKSLIFLENDIRIFFPKASCPCSSVKARLAASISL